MPDTQHRPAAYDGMGLQEAVKLRSEHMVPVVRPYYHDSSPVMLVEGSMQWVWDHTGKRYLDMWGGIVTVGVGHAHPKVNDAVKSQLDKIQHTTALYMHPLQGEYAAAVTARFPKEHEWRVIFTNSGSEANDLATLMARTFTGNFEYVVNRNGYHGMTEGTRGLTSARGWKWPPLSSIGVRHALHASKYRGVLPAADDACSTCAETGDCVCTRYASDLRSMLTETCSPQIAGYVAEPIQGVGGVYEMPEGYFPRIYEVIRSRGGVCTADEVQTGWGRLGTHFWGFEYAGVVPDMVVCAKSIANGFPLGAVVAKREIAEAFQGNAHFNTYGGNPMCLAAGLATLRVIEEEGMQENSRLRGEQMKAGLLELQEGHPIIGDIRGRGLMVGIEFVKDRTTKEPATDEVNRLQEMMRDEGVLIGKCGTYNNCFRFVPPMCVTDEDIDFFLHTFGKCLARL
eukprot:TRINITY_DN124_c0_g1_i1.p1 TRINITY_DN124_c0_g1~~TRINITY_DN124_c0_g1_i1.p1  ORF type:complete len:500 (+),score=191.20 TRINITY_DN124_c0_g1_i1:137-1501(+)